MDELYSHLMKMHGDATAVCRELRECLEEERECLVSFQVSEIPQTTLRKESLVARLLRKRTELKEFLRIRFGLESVSQLETKLSGEDQAAYRKLEKEWRDEWAQTRSSLRRNQTFLKHSLRNLSMLADNLRRCLGEHSTYNAKGGRVESESRGKVVTGQY